MTASRVGAVGVLILAALVAGCGGGRATYVTQMPQWNYEVYERIAVLPPKVTDRRAARDADVLTDRLTTLLAGNVAFTVLSRAELKDVFQEQDLSKLVDAVNEDQALPEGKLEIAQALVAAKITDYKLIAEKQEHRQPVYRTDRRGRRLLDRAGRPIVAGEEVVTMYRHGAEVEGSVRVIDAATGKILLSHSARIAPKVKTGYNRPPRESPEALAADAMQELAVEFYKQVAPTRTKVKLSGDALIVATDYYDGRYDETKSLPISCAEFLLVVRDLPPECDRNQFRVTITEEAGRADLFEQEFIWSGSVGAEGVSYRVPLEALTKTGGERFTAKLYSGRDPEPILTRKFKLEAPKATR